MLKRLKRGQLGISFGIIFSIFLIIVFIFFAFKAIGFFLDLNKCVDTSGFLKDLQSEIDKARSTSASMRSFSIGLGKTVDKICFVNITSPQTGPNPKPDKWSQGDNFFIVHKEDGCNQLSSSEIKGINITQIIELENPKCFDARDELQIKKTSYSRLVEIN